MAIDISDNALPVDVIGARLGNDVFFDDSFGALTFDDRENDAFHIEKSSFNNVINFKTKELDDMKTSALNDKDIKIRRDKAIERGIRASSIFNEGVRYGAQSGYSHAISRFYDFIGRTDAELSGTYNFSALMLANGRVMPPIISLSEDAISVTDDQYTHIDSRYRIAQQAKFLRKPPSFRDYLGGIESNVKQPSKFSIPLTSNELTHWANGVYEGWRRGRRMADQEIASRINKLSLDWLGLVRYHALNKYGAIESPITTTDQIGTNSDDSALDVGITNVYLNKNAAFNGNSSEWRALPKIDKLERRFNGKK